jgi:hypothetical protein
LSQLPFMMCPGMINYIVPAGVLDTFHNLVSYATCNS